MRNQLPTLVLLLASMLWGAAWWPLKLINQHGIDGIALILVAYTTAAILLLPLFLRQYPVWRARLPYLFLIMLLGGYANLAFTAALIYGEVVRTMVLFYLLPLWGVLGGKLFLHERIDSWRRIGVMLAIGGAFLILGGPQLLDSPPSWFDLLAISSGMGFALNNIVFRADQITPLPSKLVAMFLGCSTLAGLLLLAGVQSWPEIHVPEWRWVLLYGASWLLLANLGSQWGVTHMEAGRASIIIIMELVTAVVTATWIGNESLSRSETIGGLLILTAAFLEARRPAASTA